MKALAFILALPLASGAGEPNGRWALAPGDSRSPGDTRLETIALESRVFGNTRSLRVLLPPGYDEEPDRRYPVLYLLDGQTLFDAGDFNTTHAWDVDETVEVLLAQGAIEPLIVVGIDNPGLRERPRELLPWFDEYLQPPLPDPQGKQFPGFLVDEVLPRVAARYRVLEGAEHTGLGGVSYGGLAALYAVIHRPGVFGRLLVESPGLYVNGAAVLDEAEGFEAWPRKISLAVGTNEEGRPGCVESDMSSEAVRDVLRLEAILGRHGLSKDRLRLQIDPCAEHDEQAWGRRLPGALRFLYGPGEGGTVIQRVGAEASARLRNYAGTRASATFPLRSTRHSMITRPSSRICCASGGYWGGAPLTLTGAWICPPVRTTGSGAPGGEGGPIGSAPGSTPSTPHGTQPSHSSRPAARPSPGSSSPSFDQVVRTTKAGAGTVVAGVFGVRAGATAARGGRPRGGGAGATSIAGTPSSTAAAAGVGRGIDPRMGRTTATARAPVWIAKETGSRPA